MKDSLKHMRRKKTNSSSRKDRAGLVLKRSLKPTVLSQLFCIRCAFRAILANKKHFDKSMFYLIYSNSALLKQPLINYYNN